MFLGVVKEKPVENRNPLLGKLMKKELAVSLCVRYLYLLEMNWLLLLIGPDFKLIKKL
jgi:hypothetical protein